MPYTPEIYAEHISPVASENQRQRGAAFTSLLRLEPAVLGDRLPAQGILGPGTYAGAKFAGAVNLSALGVAVAGAAVEFAAGSSGIVRGVTFKRAVTIRSGVTVEFTGCVFEVEIAVDSGGKVACTACRFDGTSAIINAGAVGNTVSVGCVKVSPTAHTNTVVIGEVV